MKYIFIVILNLLIILPVSAEVITGGVEYGTGVIELEDRTIAQFSDGSYGICYKDSPKEVLYYSKEGGLTHKEIKESLEYPYKAYKYKADGRLENVSLRVSETETYIYTPSGKLLAHWVGKNCYNAAGEIIMTRQVY